MVEEFEELLDQSMAGDYSVGSTVKGKVVQISEEGIFVDIGTKSEAILNYNKIIPEDIPGIQVGDAIESKIIGRKDGIFYLSKKALDFERGWQQVRKDFESQTIVKVRIVRKVTNGYLAEAYKVATGFIHEKNFKKPPEIGNETDSIISEFNQKNKKVVYTRKPIIIAEKQKKLAEEYDKLEVGQEMEGRVEKLSNFGAFVRITDHIVGLLHISEMSHDHIKAPSTVCKVGDKIKVKIINIEKENARVGLSHKETYTDPILDIVEGEDYDGTIENVTEFGAFVRLPNGVVGLVHISEISYARFEKPEDMLKSSKEAKVKVLNVNIRDRRVSLSIKALEEDPWLDIDNKFTVGERVDVKVRLANKAGLVVMLDDFLEGFIPIGEISHERIEHPGKLYSEGDTVKAQILNIDDARRKIRLSIRQTIMKHLDEDEAPVARVTKSDAKPTGKAMTLGDVLAKSGLVAELAEEEPAEKKEKEPVEEKAEGEKEQFAEKKAGDKEEEPVEKEGKEEKAKPAEKKAKEKKAKPVKKKAEKKKEEPVEKKAKEKKAELEPDAVEKTPLADEEKKADPPKPEEAKAPSDEAAKPEDSAADKADEEPSGGDASKAEDSKKQEG